MIDPEVHASIIRKRAGLLVLPPEALAAAAEAMAAAGVTRNGAVEQFRKEWLNDLVATTDAAAFRHASDDPSGHFVRWAAERAGDPFHVSWRAVEAGSRLYGPEIALRGVKVVWRQEIAWAQRTRLSENPHAATKAAMFLREAEGGPARLFLTILDIYTDAMLKPGYVDSPAHGLAPETIRFADEVPDFSPLFLTHAARSYGEALHSMPRVRVEALAARAAADESRERAAIAARTALSAARRFPMRRTIPAIATAASCGLTSNEAFLFESAFLAAVENGTVTVAGGNGPPQADFVAALANPKVRPTFGQGTPPDDFEPSSVLWEIANLGLPAWSAMLPDAYRDRFGPPRAGFEEWREAVVREQRETPYDPVCDFGFFMIEREHMT